MCAFSEAIHKLYSAPEPLDGVHEMLPCLSALFRSRHVGLDVLPFDGSPPRILEILNRAECNVVANAYREVIDTSPNVQFVRRGGFAPVLRISNHLSERKFRETAFYQEIFRRMGWRDQLGIAVRLKTEALGITFHRDSEFSDEEADIAGLLQRHIAARFGAASPLAAPQADGIWNIPLDSDLAQTRVPNYVAGLFRRYFPEANGASDEFPFFVRRWLAACLAANVSASDFIAHKRIPSREGTLVLGFVPSIASRPACLAVEEKQSRYAYARLEQLGLTDRQIDIAFWLTQGKTDAEMGILLSVSPRTVNKHLESLLAKLGSANRTCAAVQLIEWLSA